MLNDDSLGIYATRLKGLNFDKKTAQKILSEIERQLSSNKNFHVQATRAQKPPFSFVFDITTILLQGALNTESLRDSHQIGIQNECPGHKEG